MKDLPIKLTAKIPAMHKRDIPDNCTDEERLESDGEDPSQFYQIQDTSSSSQRELMLLDKIELLTQKLEEAKKSKARTSSSRLSHYRY